MTNKQSTPEEFLREAIQEIIGYKLLPEEEQRFKGWARLLELREEAVRDETRRLDYAEFLGMVRHMENNASQLRRHFEHRVEALTTPNNTQLQSQLPKKEES